MISIQNLFFFIFSSMVRSTKRIPKTLFIASTTIVGGISILFGQFASPARKNGDPFGRLMALLSLSLSSIHVGTCSNSPFSLAYFLTRSIISFFFSFPVPVSEDRARYTCHKAKLASRRSFCQDLVKQRCI